jgi:hypothetical protein
LDEVIANSSLVDIQKFDQDETLPNQLYKKKPPKQRREKETRGKDRSPGKQTAQKRPATRRKGNH